MVGIHVDEESLDLTTNKEACDATKDNAVCLLGVAVMVRVVSNATNSLGAGPLVVALCVRAESVRPAKTQTREVRLKTAKTENPGR